jgi:hypothetical protein
VQEEETRRRYGGFDRLHLEEKGFISKKTKRNKYDPGAGRERILYLKRPATRSELKSLFSNSNRNE